MAAAKNSAIDQAPSVNETSIEIGNFIYTAESGYVLPKDSFHQIINFRDGLASIELREGNDSNYICANNIALNDKVSVFLPDQGFDLKTTQSASSPSLQDGGIKSLAIENNDVIEVYHLNISSALQTGGGRYIEGTQQNLILNTVSELIENAKSEGLFRPCDENENICSEILPEENMAATCEIQNGTLTVVKNSEGCDIGFKCEGAIIPKLPDNPLPYVGNKNICPEILPDIQTVEQRQSHNGRLLTVKDSNGCDSGFTCEIND